MNATHATFLATGHPTYTEAMRDRLCIECGAPASIEPEMGSPYCRKHKRRHVEAMEREQREHPQRFAW
jgi:hypothetical protein